MSRRLYRGIELGLVCSYVEPYCLEVCTRSLNKGYFVAMLNLVSRRLYKDVELGLVCSYVEPQCLRVCKEELDKGWSVARWMEP